MNGVTIQLGIEIRNLGVVFFRLVDGQFLSCLLKASQNLSSTAPTLV